MQNSVGSSAPYARNLGGVISSYVPSTTQQRPRGYGLGNGLSGIPSAPGEEKYYTQPGWPADLRNKSVFTSSRKERLGFSLRDTPLTIAAKAAARVGVPLNDYRLYTDDDSPTRALLQLTGGRVGRAEAEVLVAEAGEDDSPGSDVLLVGAAGVPEDAAERALAVALANGESLLGSDKFSREAEEVLSVAEKALLATGVTIESCMDKANVLQTCVRTHPAH
jgi:hypothetical protein